MPTYSYKCTACQKEFNEFFLVKTEKTVCPDCGAEATKQMNTSMIQVKGYNAANNYSRTNKEDRK